MLKYNQVNPLTVFGLRQLEHCPPHFTSVDFDLRSKDKTICDWVWANLTGRFWYGRHYYKDAENNVHQCCRIGFEEPGEASMFALILDTINKHEFD
jgi:hypothetical protein